MEPVRWKISKVVCGAVFADKSRPGFDKEEMCRRRGLLPLRKVQMQCARSDCRGAGEQRRGRPTNMTRLDCSIHHAGVDSTVVDVN